MNNRVESITFVLLFFVSSVEAQMGVVIRSVEEHNKTLQTLRTEMEWQMADHKVGTGMSNPEYDVDFRQGIKENEERKVEMSLTQNLDWSVISGQRRKLTRQQDSLTLMNYMVERNKVMAQTNEICINLTYTHRRENDLKLRLSLAKSIKEMYEKGLDRGAFTVLDCQSAQLNYLQTFEAYQKILEDRVAYENELTLLNGGEPIRYDEVEYEDSLTEEFETMYEEKRENSPLFAMRRLNAQVRERELSVVRASMVPDLNVGYVAEWTQTEGEHGFKVGLALPLWGNRNKVKSSRLAVNATKSQTVEMEEKTRLELKSLYEQLQAQQATLKELMEVYASIDVKLIQRALDMGQITIVEYLMRQKEYYEMCEMIRERERTCAILAAKIKWY